MPRLIHVAIPLIVLPLLCTVALAATGGPRRSVVVVDRPVSLDLTIQDVRVENADATHMPVRARLVVPKNVAASKQGGTALRWARLTAYLTRTADPNADHVSEATVKLGPRWANRSVVIEVPSPGEGEFSVHVRGEFRLADPEPVVLLSTTTQRVRFGTRTDCIEIEDAPIPGIDASACPLLFDDKKSDPKSRAENRRILDVAIRRIDELCSSGALRRVGVRGWASTTHSDSPTNEELAQMRGEAVTRVLRDEVPGCAEHIQNDSISGIRGVTEQFGDTPEANQCAQIHITQRTCKN